MAKKKTKTSASTITARSYAAEKYGPAIAQVVAAHGKAREDLASDIETAKRSADSGKAYALNAIPNVQKTYSEAMSKADADNEFIRSEMAKLGGAADVFKGANIKSQGSEHDRITAAGANAEQGLRDRATAAEAGKQFATNQARADYRKTTGALRQQLLDLKTQAGQAAANKLSELLQADLDRQNKLDVADIGASATTGAAKIRADAQAEKDAAKKNKPVFTAQQRIKNRSAFGKAKQLASSLKTGGKFKDPDTGKTTVIPPTKDWRELYQAMLDTYPNTDGTIARGVAQLAFQKLGPDTARTLKTMGIKAVRPTKPPYVLPVSTRPVTSPRSAQPG